MTVDLEWRLDGRVGVVRINNEPLNTLTLQVHKDLQEAFSACDSHDSCRVVVLASGGLQAFSAGQDLREAPIPEHRRILPEMLDAFFRTCYQMRSSPHPIVAAIDGPAYGGGLELALNCDIRVAARDISLAASSARMGLIASATSLARIVGRDWASYLLLSAREISSQEAMNIGLVHQLSERSKLMEEVLELANRIASNSPSALRAIKQLLRSEDEEAMWKVEQEVAHDLAESPDHAEAVSAFFEARRAVFGM